MRWSKAFLVFRKDVSEVARNWEVMAPMIILPVILTVLIPAMVTLVPDSMNGSKNANLMDTMIPNLPEADRNMLAGFSEAQQMIYIMLLYFFAPFFLIIPLMVSGVIASDSFAGEKERKTIEALLAAPFTDSELLMGKILASFAPAMGATIISFSLYTVMVDALTFGRFGFLLLPNLTWLVMILFLAPAASLLGIGATVIISSRVKGFREAQQLSALLVVPVLALLFGQAAGFLIMGPVTLLVLTVLVLVVDAALFGVGVSLFNREKILSQSH
ncbi:MAG: ABC transporter permease subunit [Candidatus Bathyarchaeota archaeon]